MLPAAASTRNLRQQKEFGLALTSMAGVPTLAELSTDAQQDRYVFVRLHRSAL